MQVCNALANNTRFEMLKILVEEDREICICEFEDYFEKDTSVLYRNIRKLSDVGLISTRKEGRKLLSRVEDREAVKDLIGALMKVEPGKTEDIKRKIKA